MKINRAGGRRGSVVGASAFGSGGPQLKSLGKQKFLDFAFIQIFCGKLIWAVNLSYEAGKGESMYHISVHPIYVIRFPYETISSIVLRERKNNKKHEGGTKCNIPLFL